jgi:hypothetical protein
LTGYRRASGPDRNSKTGKRCNLGTFSLREQVERHEREIQYVKRR